jgi:hypothetical protein
MAAKLTRLTHEIAMQLHLVAESCTICSTRSRRPIRKLLDTPSIPSISFRHTVNSIDLGGGCHSIIRFLCLHNTTHKKASDGQCNSPALFTTAESLDEGISSGLKIISQYKYLPAGWTTEVRLPAVAVVFLCASLSRPAFDPTHPPIQWIPGTLPPRVKRPGRETDHSPPSGAEVKNT